MAVITVRSLLVACFALLVAACPAECDINRRLISNNCAEYLTGKTTTDAVILRQVSTNPYQKVTRIDKDNNCLLRGKRLVGALIIACDPLGPPPPSIRPLSILSQEVTCETEGPCIAGLTVNVSQYCDAM